MERIVVVGAPGSGKSTLTAAIARALDLPSVELDALWWGPEWTGAGNERFCERLDSLLGDRWVVDGSYYDNGAREAVWPRADTVVWLDLPRRRTFWRVVRRTVSRTVGGVELWNGNRETVRNALSRDSVVWFAWRNHPKYRRNYERAQVAPDMAHLHGIRLRTPREVRSWRCALERDEGG